MKEGEVERERGRENASFIHPLIYTPEGCKSQLLAVPKPRTFFTCSHVNFLLRMLIAVFIECKNSDGPIGNLGLWFLVTLSYVKSCFTSVFTPPRTHSPQLCPLVSLTESCQDKIKDRAHISSHSELLSKR